MKYFSPSYLLKVWVLSAPLFNSKNEGIYAKSIDNRNIKDWASNNTNLELIENQTLNLFNNQTIQFQNHENIPSSKNLETDHFYENFLKTQGWSRDPAMAQQQVIKNEKIHQNFLEGENEKIIKRKKRQGGKRPRPNDDDINPNNHKKPSWNLRPRTTTTTTTTTTTLRPPMADEENDSVIINNYISDNNRHYENTLYLRGEGDYLYPNDANNEGVGLWQASFHNFEQNYGFRMLYNWFFVNRLGGNSRSTHLINRLGEPTSQLFPDSIMLREYNRYVEGYDMRQDNLGNFYDPNGLRRYMSWKGTPRLLYDRYLFEVNDRLNGHIPENNNLQSLRSSFMAFEVLNEIMDEAYRNNQHNLNLRYHINNNFRMPILADSNLENIRTYLSDPNLFQVGEEDYIMRNRVITTYINLFSAHFNRLINLSLRNQMPFVFLTNINNFPREMFRRNRNYNRASNNYFVITGASNDILRDAENNVVLENIYYRIYDPINRNTYHINGRHFLSIINQNNFHFAFGYDNARQTLDNGQIINRDIREVVPEYVNFERDRNNFNLWAQRILEWIPNHSNIELNCDNFDKFTENLNKNGNNRPPRTIKENDECIINQNSWYLKLIKENIYNIFSLNINNKDNSRKKLEKFVSTDKGFYFVNLNNEIVKIVDFKKIIDIIADNQGSVYITDEFANRYHINLYDWDHTNISSNIMIDDDSYQNIIYKLSSFKDVNDKLPIITSLHQVQEDEYNDETSWQKNNIFVGTDQGAYLYNNKERVLDKFSNLNIPIKNFQLTRHESYAINPQGWKFNLDLFNDQNSYNPFYEVNPLRDFKEEYDAWGSNNDLWLHISYDNVMHMIHSFLYNNKNDFVNYLLNDYLNKLNISDLFNESEKNNIVNAIWQNFPDFHEKSLNIHDGQSLVLHIDGKGNWLEDNVKIEEYHNQQIIIANRENYNFKPFYEINNAREDQELQILGKWFYSNEVMFRISHYNIHQMFKSFTYNLKNDFINNFIDGFLKKLSIKKIGSFLSRDHFYDDYYQGLANTIWNHFGDFHEQALLVKPDQAIYFDMFALSGALDGALSIVKDRIHRYNKLCHNEFRSSDEQGCNLRSSLFINSKHQLLKSIHIKDEPKNSTKWNSDFTKSINDEQHLPINNKTNLVSSNIISI